MGDFPAEIGDFPNSATAKAWNPLKTGGGFEFLSLLLALPPLCAEALAAQALLAIFRNGREA